MHLSERRDPPARALRLRLQMCSPRTRLSKTGRHREHSKKRGWNSKSKSTRNKQPGAQRAVPASTNSRAVDQSWAANQSSSSCVKPNSSTVLGAGGTLGRQDRRRPQGLVDCTYGPRRSGPGPSKPQESCGPPNRALEESRKNPPRAISRLGAEGARSWANARSL